MSSAPETSVADLYSGRYRHVLDNSRRAMFPAKWRVDGAPTAFVLVLWPVGEGQHLLAMTLERWAEMAEKLRKQSLSNRKVNAVVRELGSTHERVNLDKFGRLPLPDHLAEAAGIKGEVEFMGLMDRFEIWNPARYAALEPENKKTAAEVFEQLEL